MNSPRPLHFRWNTSIFPWNLGTCEAQHTQCDLCTSGSLRFVRVAVLPVKRLRIEFYDDTGCRHTISLEGPLTRDKIARILDYAELMGGLSSPSTSNDPSQYARTKLDRVRDLVVHGFRERTFSSDDVRRHYQQLYVDAIPLTTVATYLSRLVDRGLLHRSGSAGRWRYSLAERAPSVRIH